MDRLFSLVPRFGFQSSIFFKGEFCGLTQFRATERVGHLHVVRSGRVIMENDGAPPIEISEPTLVFYPRPNDHVLHVPSASLADLLCAHVVFNQVERNPIALALPDIVQIPLRSLSGLEPTLKLLFDEASADDIGKRLVMERLCDVLVVHIVRYAFKCGLIKAGILAGLSDPRLAATLAAIHADPAHSWRIEEMASLARMSRTSFANYFRDVIGMTPAEYLTDWRMGLAESYLKENKSVKEVALAIGYSNQPAFSKAFINRYGMSPTEWLKQAAAVKA